MSLSGSVIHSTDLTDSLYSSGKHRLQIAEQSARALPAAGWLFPWLMCRNALMLVFDKSGQAATKLAISVISTTYMIFETIGRSLSDVRKMEWLV